jgi:hypothetical protein
MIVEDNLYIKVEAMKKAIATATAAVKLISIYYIKNAIK